jgi:predicted phosphodiesterase
MRYGVIADVHGNLHALQASLTALEKAGVDGYLCLGDLIGYGPFPNECVEVVAGTGAVCVAGNHDLIALGRLPDDQCIPLARESIEWTARQLTPAARDYLESLPLRAEVAGAVVLAHGSLDNPRRYVTRPEHAEEQLEQLGREYPQARCLLVGHTHRVWAFVEGSGTVRLNEPVSIPETGRLLLNPGTVGQSRERVVRAQCMVLDLERSQATFHAVPYDFAACRRALVERGLPARSCHLRPSPLGACARAARRLARRALSLARA